MSLIDALEDIKIDLRAGRTPDLASIAEDNDLKVVFLTNRAVAVLGDFSTFADRERAAADALAPSLEIAKRKMQLSKIEARIKAHNAGTARVGSDELIDLMDAANALGGNWVLKSRRQRQPKSFDALLRELAGMLDFAL